MCMCAVTTLNVRRNHLICIIEIHKKKVYNLAQFEFEQMYCNYGGTYGVRVLLCCLYDS